MRNTTYTLSVYLFQFMRVVLVALIAFLGLVPFSWRVKPVKAAEEAVKTLRVAPDGTDNSSCGSESAPCKSIQYAVNRAASGDTILVAGGTYAYTPSADTCSFLVTRAVVCLVDKHLNILGGYSTSNWYSPNPEANPTIIDGNNTYRGVAVVRGSSTASLHMENFTIQNGLAQGKLNSDAFGGGMWAINTSVTLRNVTFKNNRSIGIDVPNNTSEYGVSGSGGGLAIITPKNDAASTLENVNFEGNYAKGGISGRYGGVAIGGAFFIFEARVSGNSLRFINNTAEGGNSSGGLGGAVGIQYHSTVSLINVIAQGNQAIGGQMRSGTGMVGGGGLGGAFHVEQSTFTLEGASITDNIAQGVVGQPGGYAFGGGVMTDTANSTIERTEITRNYVIPGPGSGGAESGDAGGGGLYLANFWKVSNIEVNLNNSIVGDNIVELGVPGNTRGINGAGITVQAITANINHCTIVNNNFIGGSNFGQAIAVIAENGTSGVLATANINNSVIANHINYTAVEVLPANTVNFNTGIFSNNTRDTNINSSSHGTFNGLSTMASVPSVGFIAVGGSVNDYHIQASSPAIDRAYNSYIYEDIDGETRPANNIADIGADEYVRPMLVARPSPVFQLADDSMQPVREVTIDISSGPDLTWTAVTTADWLVLGSTGKSREISGQTGEKLVLRFLPENVPLGYYTSTVDISTDEDITLSIPVQFAKLDHVEKVFLPMTVRQ